VVWDVQQENKMSNEFRGTGNVGEQPLLKKVMVGTEERAVSELRVYFDEYRPDGQGEFTQTGGFWLDVNVWGERRAVDVTMLVKTGTRVHVVGRLAQTQWDDKESGEPRQAFHVNADEIFLSLGRIEAVQYKPRRDVQVEVAGSGR